MADTTIKVDEQVRDRLRTVAEERGLSTRALAESVLMGLSTQAERDERAARGLAYVHAHLCPDLSPHDIERADAWYADIVAGQAGEVR
ncbi:hypothetical protein [Streptomyces xanthochromogenes]|uniref:hypothetical protein n=1 Tax=Streptomyces xanthochromogenes TaxID=67384 RepID=UPI0034245469